MTNLSRSHPGVILSEKLERMSISPKEFAKRIGMPEKTIGAVLDGKCSVTAELAVQITSTFGAMFSIIFHYALL